MKRILYIFLAAVLAGGTLSCEDFLQKPDTTGVFDLDVIYSSRQNAHAALMNCYRNSLQHGLGAGGVGMDHTVMAMISGERARGYSWAGAYIVSETGLSATSSNATTNGADNYEQGWTRIRACYLIKENIDRVPDMTDEEKEIFKAEATALIAYRYMGMFYRYGGVPKVEKAFEPDDELTAPRMTLQETYDFINELCDEAYAALPAEWDAANKGRMTKGAALAIKARTAMFAARPLFNSATPYMSLGSNNDLICFGSNNPSRWNTAIEANEAVLTWARSNGYGLVKTGSEDTRNSFDEAVADYGTATSGMSNKEAILQYKMDQFLYGVHKMLVVPTNLANRATGESWDLDLTGLLNNTLEKYYTRDGADQSWPVVGGPAITGAEWVNKANHMEARMLVDWIVIGVDDHVGNPGNADYSTRNQKDLINEGADDNRYPGLYSEGKGPRGVKFYYGADGRLWTELPLFRLAETYLNLAEAYNEAGNSSKALENLNKIRFRAGLPAVTETDQSRLRQIIQRERAIELVCENHRYFDAKHWKISDISKGGLAGPMREFQFYMESNHNFEGGSIISVWEAVSYNMFWANYMYLEPFPQDEVYKGTVIQNPGY